uniref:Uncharacterized protein n=1 Tax=Oryza brachyantha TaxID=4533 RepID=J3N5G9_ORYBR
MRKNPAMVAERKMRMTLSGHIIPCVELPQSAPQMNEIEAGGLGKGGAVFGVGSPFSLTSCRPPPNATPDEEVSLSLSLSSPTPSFLPCPLLLGILNKERNQREGENNKKKNLQQFLDREEEEGDDEFSDCKEEEEEENGDAIGKKEKNL